MTNQIDPILNGKLKTFITPSCLSFTIREQNGEDDDILSNEQDAQNSLNISKFIAAIVVKTDATDSGKLTWEQAHKLKALDRYAILINSRIHSLGNTLEFTYDWEDGKGPISYEQELSEYLFDDYNAIPSEEEVKLKPNAIPYYSSNQDPVTIELTSGKTVRFNLLTGEAEANYLAIPANERTKNKLLTIRRLELKINDAWNKVESFKMFSAQDMFEIRKEVLERDPSFSGKCEIEHPSTGNVGYVSIVALPSFFYLGGM
jgi:hypothetical protein